MNELLNDHTLWIGIGLFAFSIGGIVLILKTLQKHSDSDSMVPPPENLSPNPDSSSGVLPATKEGVAHNHTLNLKTVTDQLDHIENILSSIAKKLDQPNSDKKNQLTEELNSIVKTLKSSTETIDQNQINQLSSKVDKIYQVLISLSAPEG